MARTVYLVGNWKMNNGPEQTRSLISALRPSCSKLDTCEVWIAPPFVSLTAALDAAQGTPIRIGAQNVHWENSGAFTGEISPGMLREVGASFALTGHSERRHILGESDEIVARRTIGALSKGLTVIFCIGETLEERNAGRTTEVLERQIGAIIKEVDDERGKQLLIAYEPVWAIGTGVVAGPEEIRAAHADIVRYWSSNSSTPCPPILYGGSVSPDNFADILPIEHVSGALVGGASLDAGKFSKLIAIANEVR